MPSHLLSIVIATSANAQTVLVAAASTDGRCHICRILLYAYRSLQCLASRGYKQASTLANFQG
eukprot:332431-Pelagomonas_calceolata.AAC.3